MNDRATAPDDIRVRALEALRRYDLRIEESEKRIEDWEMRAEDLEKRLLCVQSRWFAYGFVSGFGAGLLLYALFSWWMAS